ncbi:hypothetical protein SESBI_00249 [Sesbania bispinosa]|nr:hypothetical protein SESBI_00249 [Sesbania bispinosa]
MWDSLRFNFFAKLARNSKEKVENENEVALFIFFLELRSAQLQQRRASPQPGGDGRECVFLGLGRTQPRRYCGVAHFHDSDGRRSAKTRSKLLESMLLLGVDELVVWQRRE